jgi:DNA-directed RNA polymerase subunit M/transcription elongation factor TFIIS
MLVCKTCGSLLIPLTNEWVCAFCTYDPITAQAMYEKPHTKLKDKRVN